MNHAHEPEINANLERAEQSINAAKMLQAEAYHDFVASRAYYAAFYAATAALLHEGLAYSKHSGVVAAVHRHLVNTGKLDKEHGKNLGELFELRGTGDYGGTQHVSQKEAEEAIKIAEAFVSGIKEMLGRG